MNEITELVKVTKAKSILYVEDDKDIRFNVSELLKNLFSTVTSAVDGLDGLEKFKAADYDYIITDIKMPKMNGITMMEEILKLKPSQKIIITTAHDEKEFLEKFKSLGVTYILQKPITFDSLLDTLNQIVHETD
jgi:two-component system, OmpR family, response regulator VanR